MSHYNYLGGLAKVVGYIKVATDDDNGYDYEPAIYIINEKSARFRNMSFVIMLSAMYKYCDPFVKHASTKSVLEDQIKFEQKKEQIIEHNKKLRLGCAGIISREAIMASNEDLAAIMFADMIHRHDGIMLITGYNLAKCMQMFELPPIPAVAAQLLLFIEDSLDDMKNMPPAEPDKMMDAGGYTVMMGGEKIVAADWKIPASDVVAERYKIATPGEELIN